MKLTGTNKSKLNLSIDIVLFILLVAMAGIGFLMKYVVVSGEVRNVIYGNHVDLEFFGLSRHQWGSIHLILSIIFLVLLVLHIILHWKWIVTIFKCMFPSLFLKYAVAGLICLFGALALITPFLLEPEKVPFEPKYRNRFNHNSSSENRIPAIIDKEVITAEKPVESEGTDTHSNIQENRGITVHEEHHNSEYDEFEVYGYHTLQYVADRYNVPAAVICRDLKIPENRAAERLGQLRKQYAFTMTDVRKSISDYKKLNK